MQNEVPQGLFAAVFTASIREVGMCMSPAGFGCGIANVNIGTSGGEKETGGHESRSGAWRNDMRRTTNTITVVICHWCKAGSLHDGMTIEVSMGSTLLVFRSFSV